MARKIIDIGTVGNDGTGDSIRDSFRKVNENFRELYSSLGLGERLTFVGLSDVPSSYVGQNDPLTGNTPLVTVNDTESGLTFKKIIPGNGISIDFVSDPTEISISADFAEISADTSPQLGGDLSARSGGNQFRIVDLPPVDFGDLVNSNKNPRVPTEAVSKAYADSKVSRFGTNAVNTETGLNDPSQGRMSGPLILARDPEPEDDTNYDGLIAATKRYVDSSAFGSTVNLYVALSGQDDRPGVSKSLQGRALAYAYRTLEAALKRAEELVNEARLTMGPYKKVLTYNNGAENCTLDAIDVSPASGSNFSGSIRMSVDTVTLSSVGTNYFPGDILTLSGGSAAPGGGLCTIQILSTLTTPGSILTYKIISSGSYSSLPGSSDVGVTITTSAAPENIGAIGVGATFNITYKVSSVQINNGGSGYSLVSVRITGGGGAGAFGTAIVESGVITSITVTDKGSGFISLPDLNVDLPRFLIKTDFFRTDFTGDVLTETPEAQRGRDIREGLYLYGETSGALAEILSHQGQLDSEGREIFDVDVKYGSFQEGEIISYGDISKNIQISVLVESGEYYENYPLKLPANCSIVGDEFRRVIFRPRPGTSSSPWAFQKFRRDKVIDGLTLAATEYAYHYLSDPSQPVYPKIYNPGSYTSAATLIDLNRLFLQEEIIAWMDYNVENNIAPFTSTFSYNRNYCKRDVGLIVDSLVFDLKYGEYNRTISAGLKYYQSNSALVAITTQLDEYLAVLTYLESLIQDIITNTTITGLSQDLYPQIIDPAYQSESGSSSVVTALIQALRDIIDESGPGYGSVNQPKDNEEMDVFLANDAVRWQAISAIGHGGFMGVLDPTGQILSRSPYFQECASFSRSKDRQVFAGGMFADGFAGNLEFVVSNVVSSTRLEVSGLDRMPQVPASFIVSGNVYRVNYIRDFIYGIGDFNYNTTKCARDTELIIKAILDDFILGTNYKHVVSAESYLRSYSSTVTSFQKNQTIAGLNYARDRVLSIISDTVYEAAITSYFDTVTSIIDANNVSAAPALSWTAPTGVTSGIANSFTELRNNRSFLVDECIAYINDNLNPSSISEYSEATCRRDLGYFLDAISYDIYYGGNTGTIIAIKGYFDGDGLSILGVQEVTPTVQVFTRLKAVIGYIIQGSTSWTKSVSNTSIQSTSAGVGNAQITAENLIQNVIDVLNSDLTALPVAVDPTFSSGINYASHSTTRSSIISAIPGIKDDTILFINATYSEGSSATFILDETTPWPYSVFTYNSNACSRDVGLILDGLGYDIVFGTNYWTRISGFTYRLSNASIVIQEQRDITIRALEYGYTLAENLISKPEIRTTIELNSSTVSDIIDRGIGALPTLTFTLPANVTSNVTKAYNLLMDNRSYIVAEVQGWIQAQISGNIAPWATGDTYNIAKSQRDTQLVIEAAVHDLIYGGNIATRHAALKYYNNLTEASMLAAGQPARCAAAINYASYLAGRVVQNLAPASSYSTLSRVTGSAATVTEANTLTGLIGAVATSIAANDIDLVPALVSPTISSSAYNQDNIDARTAIQTGKTTIQDSVVQFVNYYGNRHELIMPGNRSMLANDHTQINDMGYGAIAANGGLLELVSIFTYYCHISYYSVTGGQIRSVSGSSAHGVYALVAEGADPLEVPTPTTVYNDFSQRVVCYYPSPAYANVTGGLLIFVSGFDYEPLGGSELEVNHSGVIYRYPVTSATTADLPAGVARLNLTSAQGVTGVEGLFDAVPDGTLMTLRANSQYILTGNLVDVAVRPSTGLKLRETQDSVYRVLQFSSFTDANGPYEIEVTPGDPGIFRVLETITTINTNVCTTSRNHRLKLGDVFIPKSTSNGLTINTTYYVIDVPAYNQFKLSLAPGGVAETLVDGSGLTIKGIKTHKLLENYTISFSTTGTLPTGINDISIYYVLATDLTETEFTISDQKNGLALEITGTGTGTHSYNMEGLTLTNLRENYNYIDLTISQPGDFTSDYPTGRTCTISIASPGVITLNSHGFSAGDVIRFTTTGALPTGLSESYRYFVLSAGLGLNSFRVSLEPGGTAVDTTGSQSGTHKVGKTTGRVGDTSFAVVAVGSNEISRVAGSRFVFLGEEYFISTYQPESVTNQPWARVILNRPLVDAVNAFSSSYTIKSAVSVRSSGSLGTLTIRISLTRVTSHDLLEIGTGSYADTNYPKEIYGPSVNALNPDTETDERDVGRCFYVTTDQYGNFSVGPYFRVDQGTGQVTFSSSIALSNLDGIGFKRGVPIAEFSTDSGFTDNATDTVPTENATRIYIDRRLGITHDGALVAPEQRIPTLTGGFLSLDGQSTMLGVFDAGNYRVINVASPSSGKDAVNLENLTFLNFQDVTLTSPSSGNILGFTGTGNTAINLAITGDVTATRSSGNLNIQINSDTIVNDDINSAAAIAQSKLNLNAATTRANATGISQADRGLASFDSAEFTVTNGWVTIKNNGVPKSAIEQIASRTVLGNNSLTADNVAEVSFSTVVDKGDGVKKAQYTSVGFLKRTSGSSFVSDADYAMIGSSAGSSSSVGANELIARDSQGDFGGRTADLQSIKIDTNLAIDTATIPTGGYVRYYGWNSAGGVLIQDGTLAADKKTAYWNDLHQFKTQNGLSDAPITCSSIQTLILTTGGNTASGTITGRWTLSGTSPNESRLQATYSADLAENYEGDKDYEVGTVLVFGGEKEVTTTSIKGDTRVAGVVSNTAAYTMFEACPGLKNLVALQGRVPCKVVGKIRKGDILVTSGIPGVAMAATGDVKVGTVVGKALVDYDSDHIGKIEIAVGRT